ncbi:hypothetical protein PtrCC142_009143 [Pyrenophora tritici-repentis]|nr:hypothetical protein PtrCC142_009143 [Pyrenophora tritici-repentis]PWO21877.1 hypothetical protein PtrARCrB10_09607 [Pyrenophora tritici-repentis]
MLPTHPLLTLSLLPLTSAWDFYANHTIGSCVEVECPAADPAEAKGQVLSGCRVQNQNHRTIGLRTFSTNITENTSQNLTWTVGMTLYDGIDAQGRNASGTRTVEKDYYLGTPANLNLSRSDLPYEGCAFLFRENKVTGPTSLGNAGPSCSDVVGDCGPALLTQARGLVANSSMMTAGDGNQTTEQTCTRLAAQFNSSLPGACETFAGQDRWNGITGISAFFPPFPPLFHIAHSSSNPRILTHPLLRSTNRPLCNLSTITLSKRIFKLPPHTPQIKQLILGGGIQPNRYLLRRIYDSDDQRRGSCFDFVLVAGW